MLNAGLAEKIEGIWEACIVRLGSVGMFVLVLIWIECNRSKGFALNLIDLSISSLPKNLTALLVGTRIVHLLLISPEFKEQLEHGCVVTFGRGYGDEGMLVMSLCQWVINVKPEFEDWRRALPMIVWLLQSVISHGLECLWKKPVL